MKAEKCSFGSLFLATYNFKFHEEGSRWTSFHPSPAAFSAEFVEQINQSTEPALIYCWWQIELEGLGSDKLWVKLLDVLQILFVLECQRRLATSVVSCF